MSVMAERAESFESDILEGFLCPICKADLKSLSRLKNHFQENHPEDQDVLKSLKDLFGKATKKILKLDESLSEPVKINEEYVVDTEIQEIGYTKTHTRIFKTIRVDRIQHFATETNKLIIRLDQLLLVDSSDRKQHEQNIVPWLDGSTVRLCPQCAKSFNLTRRQHHCRLCGTIMCHSCTLFLSTTVAKSIISGVVHEETDTPKFDSELESLRICCHCMEMLDYRRRVQLNRTSHPVICELYNHLRTLKNKIEPDVEQYIKMCESLLNGEKTYRLSDCQTLRGSIAKQGETLDAISKRIAAIPLNPEIPRAVTLQNAIRRATSNYIKDTLLSLPTLPTQAELDKLERDKNNRVSINLPQTSKRFAPPKVMADGWSPVIKKEVQEVSEDPLIQQMGIVRGYIEQARKAMKFEEVATLEAHLRELQMFYRQSARNQTTDENT